MNTAWRTLGAGLGFCLLACGGGGDKVVSVGSGPGITKLHGSSGQGGSSSSKRDAGVARDAGGAAVDAGSINRPGAPVVKLVSPANTTDPNTDVIVTTSTLTVQCEVTRSPRSTAREVNQSSVRIRLFLMDDPKMAVAGTVTALPNNLFQAEFNLTKVPNGSLHFECDADDTSMPALKGLDSLDTFLDLGPMIEIIEPKNASSHALKTPVLIKFQVSPAPVRNDDMEAEPADVKLEISGKAFTFTEDPGQPGLYTTGTDFNDRMIFPMAPVSAQVLVTAKGSRTPDSPTRSSKSDITLDSDGPVITVKSPPDSTIVRGDVLLTVEIKDPSGVNPDSVVATLNQTLHTLNHWTVTGDTYSERFDTRSFGMDLTQLTINIKASDSVGNESTKPHILRLDNLPPRLSLDPPYIREFTQASSSSPWVCSEAFDPVGTDATNDGATVSVSSMYRVMVWDYTNGSDGANYGYLAGVNPASVVLYAQRNPSTPLLIDTDGDHICDEINSKGMPAGVAPEQLALSAVSPTGKAYYSSMPTFGDSRNIARANCTAGGETTAPNLLCLPGVTEMFRVIPQPLEGKPAAIYALTPSNGSTGACNGNTWELQKVVDEGWKCLAVRAEDNIRNVGVSRPLRVCIDNRSGPAACNSATDTWPTCTDGCTPPAEFPMNYFIRHQ